MSGYLILGITATSAHSLTRLVDALITNPRAPWYIPVAQIQTREPVGRAVKVNKVQLLRGMMV